jgi:hypothetical protein
LTAARQPEIHPSLKCGVFFRGSLPINNKLPKTT